MGPGSEELKIDSTVSQQELTNTVRLLQQQLQQKDDYIQSLN